jgi:hypothetical protein
VTATCTLCGARFDAIPQLNILDEGQRNQKQFADIGRLAGEHLNKIHRKTVQTRFSEPDLMGPVPIPAMIAAIGFCAQNSAVAAYLKCDDPVFRELNEKLAQVVKRALEPVEKPAVVSLA